MLKAILRISHIAGLVLMIYLFFIHEDRTFHDIGYGIGVIGLFGFIAYFLYGGDKSKLSPRFLDILLEVSVICLSFPFIIYPFPLLIGIFTSMPFIYSVCPEYLWIEVTLYILLFITLILFYIFRSSILNPIFRINFISLGKILPIIIIISRIVFLIISIPLEIDGFQTTSLICSFVTACIIAGVLSDMPPIRFFIPSSRYTLYLRSFNDYSMGAHNDILSQFPYPVWQVANPNIFSSNSIISSFYLPTANWKDHLNYYIDRAEIVFVKLANTPGVQWEIFHHDQHIEKFIFLISENTGTTLAETYNEFNHDHSIVECISTISAALHGPVFFCLYNNTCFYSISISDIISFLQTRKPTSSIKSFVLENKIQKKISIANANSKKYKVEDSIIQILKPITTSNIIKILGRAGLALMYCIILIFAIAFVAGCILTILSIFGIEVQINMFFEAIIMTSMIGGLMLIIIKVLS